MKKFITTSLLIATMAVPMFSATKKDAPVVVASKKAGHAVEVSAKAVAKFVSWPFRKHTVTKADGSGPIQTCRPGQSLPCGDYPPVV